MGETSLGGTLDRGLFDLDMSRDCKVSSDEHGEQHAKLSWSELCLGDRLTFTSSSDFPDKRGELTDGETSPDFLSNSDLEMLLGLMSAFLSVTGDVSLLAFGSLLSLEPCLVGKSFFSLKLSLDIKLLSESCKRKQEQLRKGTEGKYMAELYYKT